MRSFYLIFLVAIALVLGGCTVQPEKPTTHAAPRKPAVPRQWGFNLSGDTSSVAAADIYEIIAQVRRIPKADHRIVGIYVSNRDRVRVKTGFRTPVGGGRTVGGGDLLIFQRQNGRWQWNGEIGSWNR